MTNIREYYEAEMQNRRAYHEAKAAGNDAGIAAAREAQHQLLAQINGEGRAYARLYRLYKDAMERGNELIDIHDSVRDLDVPDLLDMMRKNGIDRFTISSTGTSAIGTAWIIGLHGYRLEGLIEINGIDTDFETDERFTIPALVFGI